MSKGSKDTRTPDFKKRRDNYDNIDWGRPKKEVEKKDKLADNKSDG